MPLEIRELQINVTVNQQSGIAPDASSGGTQPGGGKFDKKELVNQCIEQVLEILANKKER